MYGITASTLSDMMAAEKGLSVCFIITILIANSILIFFVMRKKGFFYKPKSLIIISLAIGDIFLALFPLILNARSAFEQYLSECSVRRPATVYGNFLIHFVYGLGLIMLAVDLVDRYKRPPTSEHTSKDFLKSLVFSAIPWILGVIVVLPVTLAGITTEGLNCIQPTVERWQIMFGLSVLLPACLAAFVSFVVMCIRLSPHGSTQQMATYQITTQTVVMPMQNSTIAPYQYPAYNMAGTQVMASAPPPAYYYPQIQKPGVEPCSSSEQGGMPAQQAQVMPPPHVLQYNAPTQMPVLAPTYPVQPQYTVISTLSYPEMDKKQLLIVANIFFFLVLPYAIFNMVIIATPYSFTTDTDLILEMSFRWISVFRSLINPIIFAIYFARSNN